MCNHIYLDFFPPVYSLVHTEYLQQWILLRFFSSPFHRFKKNASVNHVCLFCMQSTTSLCHTIQLKCTLPPPPHIISFYVFFLLLQLPIYHCEQEHLSIFCQQYRDSKVIVQICLKDFSYELKRMQTYYVINVSH